MNLIFSVEGKDAYKLIKRDPGWEMQEWREERLSEGVSNKGAVIPARWETMNKGNGCYPSSVEHAVSIITERLYERKKGTKPVIDGLKEIHAMLRTIDYQADYTAEKARELL